jgi:hypothetical protein
MPVLTRVVLGPDPQIADAIGRLFFQRPTTLAAGSSPSAAAASVAPLATAPATAATSIRRPPSACRRPASSSG